MQEVGLADVVRGIEDALRVKDFARAHALLWPALDQFPHVAALWFFAGNLSFSEGRAAASIPYFERALSLEENHQVYANLGAAYRRLNLIDESRAVLTRALNREPDHSQSLVNLGATYVNEGCPELGIPYLETAHRAGKDRGAGWNLGLLYLESGRFAEGFDLYHLGIGHERMPRGYGDASRGRMQDPPVYERDQPRAGKTLLVYGEQGIGDELMFATCLPDAAREFARVIFDCHPRLEWLHRAAYGHLSNVTFYATRKSDHVDWAEHADYKMPIGDLAWIYRRDRESFDRAWTGGFYKADGAEWARYRQNLASLAKGRPIVGLAMRGGVMTTARSYRTLRPADVAPLFCDTNALFVCLDYEDMSGFAQAIQKEHGPGRYLWCNAVTHAWDFHHSLALAAACDLVVTSNQSIAHASAGAGLACRVLTPSKPAWRYGLTDGRWYWYPGESIRLYRQQGADWTPAVARAVDDIRQLGGR